MPTKYLYIMRKLIILTESQVKTVVNNIVNEQTTSNVGKVISKKDVKLYRRYIDGKNVSLNPFRDAIENTDELDLVQYQKSGGGLYFALRAYDMDKTTYVDLFNNGKYHIFSNGDRISIGTVGVDNSQKSLALYDDKTTEIYGYVLKNGKLVLENNDQSSNLTKNKSGLSTPDSKSNTPSNSSKGMNATENNKIIEWQKKLKSLGYDLGKTGPNKDGVDGKWGSKTEAAYKSYLASQKRIKEKGGTPPTVNVAPIEAPNVDTNLDKLQRPDITINKPDTTVYNPQPVKPETFKSRGEEIYFNNLYSKINKDNVVVGGRQRDRKSGEAPKQLFYRNPNTILWRGTPLSQDDLNDLNQYLNSIGFVYSQNRSREERKRNGDIKYLWTKQS